MPTYKKSFGKTGKKRISFFLHFNLKIKKILLWKCPNTGSSTIMQHV